MSSYYSTHPKKSSKVSKDTSGRLLNIIAELSVSKSNDDRRRKKQMLRKDYENSDLRLSEYIGGCKGQLVLTMNTFSEASSKLTASRRRVLEVKEKLLICKQRLHCKRNEIQKLWSQSLEHQEVIYMLKEIERLKNVSESVEELLEYKEFLKATELLVSSIDLLETKLSSVEAVKDLKSDLYILRQKLQSLLLEELHKYLYKELDSVFIHVESSRNCKSYEEIFNQKYEDIRLPKEGENLNQKMYKKFIMNQKPISVILECMHLLNFINETVENVMDRCSHELLTIVKNSSCIMYNMLQNMPYSSSFEIHVNSLQNQQQGALLQLLIFVLHQFSCVAINHYLCIDNLNRINMRKDIPFDFSSYDIAEIYSKIQSVVELFVGDYLDLQTSSTVQRTSAAFSKMPTTTDISSFFLRKAVTRTKKHNLFNFDRSSHAINTKTYLQEQKESKRNEYESINNEPHFLICEPGAKNITYIYKVLRRYITNIESALDLDCNSHCPLYTFLNDSVKIFLEQVNIEMNRLIERVSVSLHTWIYTEHTASKSNTKLKILDSTLMIHSNLTDMEFLIQYLPDCTDNLMQLFCNVLDSYKDMCIGAYKGLLHVDSDEHNIFSISWACDKSLCWLLKSLPSWIKLKVENSYEFFHQFEESPEETKLRNMESEFLIRTCKDLIQPSEIISDYNKLRNLALFHESMEWLSIGIKLFAKTLPDVYASMTSLMVENYEDDEGNEVQLTVTTKGHLEKLSEQFEDLADTSLLVLHLEVRAHCFFYILQLFEQSNYLIQNDSEEPEPEVQKLNNDLVKINDALSLVLQTKKLKYVFEGLGEVMSTVLINSISSTRKVNKNRVKKMDQNIFFIQQNMPGITSTSKMALDRTKIFYNLFNLSIEEIFKQIVEEGPEFNEKEYLSVINILYCSKDGIYAQNSLPGYILKLKQILNEVPVVCEFL